MTDLDTLKAWCHWKRHDVRLSEDDISFVKAIEDVISQSGMVKPLKEERDGLYADLIGQEHRLGARIEKLEAEIALLKAIGIAGPSDFPKVRSIYCFHPKIAQFIARVLNRLLGNRR